MGIFNAQLKAVFLLVLIHNLRVFNPVIKSCFQGSIQEVNLMFIFVKNQMKINKKPVFLTKNTLK